MPFEIAQNLQNKSSEKNIDYGTLARIEFSDIDFLLNRLHQKSFDSRMERIVFETIVSKLASIWQLLKCAAEYLENNELKNRLINDYDKGGDTSTGKIGQYRADFFHKGIHFLSKKVYYPIGVFEGRGFKGIHIRKGAKLNIVGVREFIADNSEYAITSEGVFEIIAPNTENERWILLEDFPTIISVNYNEILTIIKESIQEMKEVLTEIESIMRNGNGNNKITFLTKNGKWELIEKKDGMNTKYESTEKVLEINGDLTITPPENIKIMDGKLSFD